MLKTLPRLWRILPMWFHVLAARVVRPKFGVAVAALIFDEGGRVLLFKHTYRKFQWGIPAGGLEHREKPENAIIREFFEETGMHIQVERLLRAESAREAPVVSLIYLCSIVSGTFKESLEISEMKYFALNDLPFMLIAEKNLIRSVAENLTLQSIT